MDSPIKLPLVGVVQSEASRIGSSWHRGDLDGSGDFDVHGRVLAASPVRHQNIWEEGIYAVRLTFENFGRYVFFKHLLSLLTDHIWSHSPNFWRPKQGQKFIVPNRQYTFSES